MYLECRHRDLADPVSASQQALFDSGTSVGELARERFADGVLVEEQYFERRQAERTTQRLLADETIPALYEPAFSFEGVHTRVDILKRAEGSQFDLIEVKSSTGLKDVHVQDVAIQTHVLEGCGLPIRRTYLMRIDNNYVYQGGEHNLERLFALDDVTDRVRSFMETEMHDHLARMWESLGTADTLDIGTGRHCRSPYVCPFFGHCHGGEPEYPIRNLPNLRQPLELRLKEEGITDIREIPPGFAGLSDMHRRVRDSVIARRPYIGSGLCPSLSEIEFPAGFLDFEAFSPAVPVYVGTRPYEAIPFQWSLHILDSTGGLKHREFLADGDGDPRERFVISLLESVPPAGSLIAYSSYEVTRLRALAGLFPKYEGPLLRLCDRVVDLMRIVRTEYYHPEFRGSFSIKSVLPALVPELAYDDLEISEGNAAAASYERLIAGDVPESEVAFVREALLEYCKRDTEAMVRVYESLVEQADAR